MKLSIAPILAAAVMIACQKPGQKNESAATPIQGTWELISETKIENTDTTFTEARKDQRMIKLLNETHFSFLKHDLSKGKDTATAIFVAGGGQYKLNGNQYTEYLDYCNAREWEGNPFQFTVSIQNDTLIQSGREKVQGTDIDRIIIEKYFRVK